MLKFNPTEKSYFNTQIMHQFEIKMCKENLNIEILKKLKEKTVRR